MCYSVECVAVSIARGRGGNKGSTDNRVLQFTDPTFRALRLDSHYIQAVSAIESALSYKAVEFLAYIQPIAGCQLHVLIEEVRLGLKVL